MSCFGNEIYHWSRPTHLCIHLSQFVAKRMSTNICLRHRIPTMLTSFNLWRECCLSTSFWRFRQPNFSLSRRQIRPQIPICSELSNTAITLTGKPAWLHDSEQSNDDDQWRYSPDRALAYLTGFMIVYSTVWGYQLHDRPVLDTLIQPSETFSSNYQRISWRSRETWVRNGRWILPTSTYRARKVLLHAVNQQHGADGIK
jgi:hypothetical protein